MNTPTHIQREVFTDRVLASLQAAGKPVGDAEAPRGGVAGWIGEPNDDWSNFVPYVVVTPLQVSGFSGPLADSQGDVALPYAMTSYGVSRQQCEWMADAARSAIRTMNGVTVTMDAGTEGEYNRKVINLLTSQIGAVSRVAETNPPYYGQTDIIVLVTSR